MSSRSQRSAIACERVAQVGAVGHLVDDDAELAADRVGHLDGQQVERGGDRMARAQAADEDVERDRELLLHLLARAGGLELQEHQREPGPERRRRRSPPAASGRARSGCRGRARMISDRRRTAPPARAGSSASACRSESGPATATSMRSNLRPSRSSAGGRSFGSALSARRSTCKVSPCDLPWPIILSRRLIAWPSERLRATQLTKASIAEQHRTEDAGEREGLEPGRAHAVELRVGPEQVGRQADAVRQDVVEEARPDAGRLEAALDLSVGVDAGLTEAEDLLHRDDVAFHAGELGQAEQLAAAVGRGGRPG